MYFKSVEIENVGPIEHLLINFPFEAERPKPLILVGENGTGKSILLSHLVNSLISGKGTIYDDVEVETGKVYKHRSASYIKSGKDYFYAAVKLGATIAVEECQLRMTKTDFESQLSYTPSRSIWNNIPNNQFSVFLSTFNDNNEETNTLFKKQCCLYFPVNRFEEPGWLNLENLKSKASYSDLKHIQKFSNRNIICTSPLKTNIHWLLDLIFDRQAFEIQTREMPIAINNPEQPNINLPVFIGFRGQSTNIYNAVLQILKVILRDSGNIRLGAGTRKNRQIAIMKDEKQWVPNLFQLSTGEIQLLNLFVSILRDYDLSEGSFENLNDIKGVVIIDEIDSHLHTSHQKEVLPELIASFPNVQFIITTHSPLFLLGMENKFGTDNFLILNMPNGVEINASDFTELNAAYEAFKETILHKEEIRTELLQNSKPIIYVEGDYDIRYLNKAAEHLNRTELLSRVQVKDGNGYGGLDKIWRAYDSLISEAIPNKIILLYDCDTNKHETNKGQVYKRVIQSLVSNPINIGIENLFSVQTIEKIENAHPEYIDFQAETTRRIRGNNTINSPIKSVNKDEKGNMCNWLCKNGSEDDFANFASIFNTIEEIINN